VETQARAAADGHPTVLGMEEADNDLSLQVSIVIYVMTFIFFFSSSVICE
jgi:hypothetical protein